MVSFTNHKPDSCPFPVLGSFVKRQSGTAPTADNTNDITLRVPFGDIQQQPMAMWPELEQWTASRQLDLRFQLKAGEFSRHIELASSQGGTMGQIEISAVPDDHFWTIQNNWLRYKRVENGGLRSKLLAMRSFWKDQGLNCGGRLKSRCDKDMAGYDLDLLY